MHKEWTHWQSLSHWIEPTFDPLQATKKRSTSEQKMFIKSFHPQYNTIKLQRENIISNRHLTINRRNYSSQVKLTKRRQQRKSSTSLSLHPFFGTTEIENPPYFSWLSYDTSINPYFSIKSIHIQVHYHFIMVANFSANLLSWLLHLVCAYVTFVCASLIP
jgi:hypothetical protein